MVPCLTWGHRCHHRCHHRCCSRPAGHRRGCSWVGGGGLRPARAPLRGTRARQPLSRCAGPVNCCGCARRQLLLIVNVCARTYRRPWQHVRHKMEAWMVPVPPPWSPGFRRTWIPAVHKAPTSVMEEVPAVCRHHCCQSRCERLRGSCLRWLTRESLGQRTLAAAQTAVRSSLPLPQQWPPLCHPPHTTTTPDTSAGHQKHAVVVCTTHRQTETGRQAGRQTDKQT
eukprot:SAG25_NODE_83_length_16558_cov_10.239307_8_plen_226_part_00